VKVSVVCPGFVKTPILENYTAVNFDATALAGEVPKLLTDANRRRGSSSRGQEEQGHLSWLGPTPTSSGGSTRCGPASWTSSDVGGWPTCGRSRRGASSSPAVGRTRGDAPDRIGGRFPPFALIAAP